MSTAEKAFLDRPDLVYPESDGQPMAENTRQFQWIVTIEGGLDALFKDDPNVFVAGDLFWYPVEGDNKTRTAPDTMVVFGRPKGHRGSWLQWLEENTPPQVVFEILSPGNRVPEMTRKFWFYDQYGVEEYYIYDPDVGDFSGWIRGESGLKEIAEPIGWTSPRLGVRFERAEGELQIIGPDGRPFPTYVELSRQRDEEQLRAEQERQRAEQERQRAEQERQRAERLAAQLKALGQEPQA